MIALLVTLAVVGGGGQQAGQTTAETTSRSTRCDYDCRWDRRWFAEPPGWRTWAKRTVGCETQGIPWRRKARAHDRATGWRYHGGLQFSYKTWRWAQRYLPASWRVKRDPHKGTSLRHQMVVGIELAQHEGTGHWPVCGH